MKPMKPSYFMNRVLLFVLLLVVGNGALSQERIDTLYYSRSGVTVRNPVFADYYRLALYPADSAGIFRQSIRSMIAGQCLTETLFPISRMVTCRKNHIIREDCWKANIGNTTRMER